MTPSATTDPRQKLDFCATFSERSGEEIAGSAWAVRRHLLVELALPWPEYFIKAKAAPAGSVELMEQVYADLHWSQVPGVIAIAPDPAYAIPGKVRLFHYAQPADQQFGTYTCDAYAVDPDHLLGAIRTFIYSPDDPSLESFRIPQDPATRDLLVCTHGTVDACCATLGAPIFKLMRAMADQAKTPTRVWRCTHFGGHRFAPTALDLPTGHYWGRLKPDTLSGLIHRSREASDYRPLYRGSTSLPEALWQRAEAELFAQAGWAWFDVRGTNVEADVTEEAGGSIVFEFDHHATGPGRVSVNLTPTGTIETRGTSDSPETFAAMQYRAEITTEHPPGMLTRLRDSTFVGPV